MAGGAKPAGESYDADQVTVTVPSVKVEYLQGSMTARLYKDRAFSFEFFVRNATEHAAFRTADVAEPGRTRIFCPIVFERTLSLLGTMVGRPDEIIRPGELTMADTNREKSFAARWWLSDGTRVGLSTTMKEGSSAGQCTQFISIFSGTYAKPLLPEIVSAPK